MNVSAVVEAINSDFGTGFYQGFGLYDAANPTVLAAALAFRYLPGFDTMAGYRAFIENEIALYAAATSNTVVGPITWPDPLLATIVSDGLMSAADKALLDALVVIVNASVSVSGYMSATDKTKLDGLSAPAARVFSTPTFALNTAYQLSTTRDAHLAVSIAQTISLLLTTSLVIMKYADDAGMTTSVKEVGRTTASAALASTTTTPLSGFIPAGKYMMLVATGTGSQSVASAQQVLL